MDADLGLHLGVGEGHVDDVVLSGTEGDVLLVEDEAVVAVLHELDLLDDGYLLTVVLPQFGVVVVVGLLEAGAGDLDDAEDVGVVGTDNGDGHLLGVGVPPQQVLKDLIGEDGLLVGRLLEVLPTGLLVSFDVGANGFSDVDTRVEFVLLPASELGHLLTDDDGFEETTILVLVATLVGAAGLGALAYDLDLLQDAVADLGGDLLVVPDEGIEVLDLFFEISLLHFYTDRCFFKPFLV